MGPNGSALVILHFGELWLRGRNRSTYIRRLKSNIVLQMKGEDVRLRDAYDRIILEPGKNADIGSITSKASRIFGVSAYETAYTSKPTLRGIVALSARLLDGSGITRLKINSHRSHKGFKFNSIDIIREVAKRAEKIGIEPHVKGYDGEIYISVTKECAYVFVDRKRGAGGLPVGTSGRCVVLLSGGIDSPVAAWYAMKRGLVPVYVHVHGYSSGNEAASSKISEITRLLSAYWPGTVTYYVPSHLFQMASMGSGRYELVLMKAFMMKLAERIAEKEGAGAIVTGESLGQVASQTLSNMSSEQYGIGMPVLRPLVGLDKQEITNLAISIGTYQESLKPYKDVCSINARSPATRSKPELIRRMAEEMKLDSVVKRSMEKSLRVELPSHS